MARIAGVPPARAGLLVRFAYRFAQRPKYQRVEQTEAK